MPTIRPHAIRTALIATAFAAGAAFLLPGAAAAAPTDHPLLNTTCTFAQVDAAMHKITPDLAERLDANPERKGKVAEFFGKSADERKAFLAQKLAENPGAKQFLQQGDHPRAAEAAAKAREIADTCHQY
ncbi:hemophore-related protein [Aldersonia kunmingensis]|uniref:hemophore-related protein n=1 Tax=Aldersonia kunmingensis TaxID=408066 RepID=UPI000833CB63|nr:hemophore-related protein [Aldersonia kunmingensis]